jgi:hypothetical protein
MKARELNVSLKTASAEDLRPLVALVGPGEVASLTGRPGVSVQVETGPSQPGRLVGLERYPDARRLVLPVGDGGLGLVLLRETRHGRRLEGWATARGQAVLIEPGVWHAPPWPLIQGSLLEAIETSGPADRVDHGALEDLIGMGAAVVLSAARPSARVVPSRRISVPPPPPVPKRPLPLDVEPAVGARLGVGVLVLDDLEVGPPRLSLLDELRAWGHGEKDLAAARVRALAFASALGLGDIHGTLRSRALRGLETGLLPTHCVEALLWRAAVGRGIDLIAAAIDDASAPYRVRWGRSWETTLRPSGHEVALEGRLVFESADRLLATEGGALAAGRIHARTKTIAVLALVPRGRPEVEATRLVSALGRELADLGGGRVVHRGFHT